MKTKKNNGKRMQLFCIPFAGGSKNAFKELESYIDENIEVILLEYPGHDSRISEDFCNTIDELKRDVFEQIKANRITNIPYAILGYSMGSIVAYEILRDIYEQNIINDIPSHVFLCANESLLNYKPRVNFDEMNSKEVQQKLISMGGIDERFLNNPRFLNIFLRPVEADYKVLTNYRFNPNRTNPKVRCSILYSPNDTTYQQVENWINLFDSKVDFYEFGNNHFFIHTESEKMAKLINRLL